MIKNIALLITYLFIQACCFANDGAYFASGNQLIPVVESDIEVRKEILTLKKVKHDHVEVSVYYEFFNPGEEKTILVGFEAFSPSGDADGAPVKGHHPYMRDFTVDVNDSILKYEVSYVEDSIQKVGKINAIDLSTYKGSKEGNWISFYYVYHFNATFKPGVNVVKHTYQYDLSGGICYDYSFDYILSAANRWGNHQIDDFTLIFDPGEFSSFDIKRTFFKDSKEWLIAGIGKVENTSFEVMGEPAVQSSFHIRSGNIIYQAKNFKPSGELFIESQFCFNGGYPKDAPPFSLYSKVYSDPSTDFAKKAFKNLPFARRGYVFKNKDLQAYYEKTPWYIPNPNYVPDVEELYPSEKKWIEKYK